MTGLEGVVGKRMSELLPELEQEWHQMLQDVYLTGEAVRIEYPVKQLGQWYSVYLSRLDGPGTPFIACIYDEITERRQQQEHKEFLVKLGDLLRASMADAMSIKKEALKLLGEQFNVMRAIYYEGEEDQDTFTLTALFKQDAQPIPKQLRLSDFSPTVADAYRGGRMQMVTDNESEPSPQVYKAIGVRALLAFPFLKDGRLVTIVSVHSKTARKWTAAEVRMLEEFADHLWAAVERANIEQQVHDSERRLRIAIEAADMATWEWDLVQNQVIWNEQHFRLFGMQPRRGPVDPDTFFEHIHPSYREQVDRQLSEALASDIEFDTEFLAMREDGSQRWMSGYGRVTERSDGQPTSMSGVMFDITARREAEIELRRIEARQTAIIESATDYAIITLDLDMRVRDWNVGAENMMGYSENEILGTRGKFFSYRKTGQKAHRNWKGKKL